MKLRFSISGHCPLPFCMVNLFLASEALAVELKAGVAKVVITPKEVLKTTAGKLDDGTMLSSDGVDHDIYGRVLVLDDGSKKLVIVTCDLSSANMIAPILWKRCQAELGIDRSQVIVVSTHNHQGPMPRCKANFPYLQEAGNKIFEAVQQAVAAEKGPVKVEFGSGYGYWVRSSGSAPVDYEIQVLKVSYKKNLWRSFQPADPSRIRTAGPKLAPAPRIRCRRDRAPCARRPGHVWGCMWRKPVCSALRWEIQELYV